MAFAVEPMFKLSDFDKNINFVIDNTNRVWQYNNWKLRKDL